MPVRTRDHLNTRQEAAERLGTSVATLDRWRYVGEGPAFVKLGPRQVRYLDSDLDAFIEAGQRPGAA